MPGGRGRVAQKDGTTNKGSTTGRGGRQEEPEATPKQQKENDKCPDCSIKVKENDLAALCDACRTWFHKDCQEISDVLYSVMNSSEVDNISWYCSHCKRGVKCIMQQMISIHDKQNQYEKRLADFEKKWDDDSKANTDKFKDIQDRVEVLEQNGRGEHFNTKEVLKELEDRERRAKSIVLFNVPESEAEDAATRKSHDITMTKNICVEELKVDDIQVENAIRLGKKDTNQNESARPMRIGLKSQTSKYEVL